MLKTARLFHGSYALAASLLLVWVGVALSARQPLTATQGSSLLLWYGACDGSLLTTHEWWRLVTSQWLHSKLLQMLFNAAVIAFVGALLERSLPPLLVLIIYVSGGIAAQFASVVAHPSLVSSGASQPMLVLCGTAMAVRWCRRAPSASTIAVLVIVAIQVGIDIREAGTVKIGHAVGLMLGFAAGMIVRLRRENRAAIAASAAHDRACPAD